MSRAGATAIWQSLRNGDYPIIMLEWRRMMRKSLQLWVLLIAGVALFLMASWARLAGLLGSIAGGETYGSASVIAMVAVFLLAALKPFVLLLVVPGYAARAIAAQRESATFEMLAVTPMRSRFIIGQIAAIGLAQVLVAMLLALPVMATGPAQDDFFPLDCLFGCGLAGELLYLVTAATYISAGVLCSCISRSMRGGVFATYALIIVGVSAVLLAVHRLAAALSSGRLTDAASTPFAGVSMTLSGFTMAALTALFAWLAVHALNSARRGRLGGLA